MEKIELTARKGPAGLQYDVYQTICMKLQAKAKQAENLVRVIVVTSTTAEEGQEAVAANLAVVMANTGVKTLLIDCDLRTPVLHDGFQLPNRGLTDCLTTGADYHEYVQRLADSELDVVPDGHVHVLRKGHLRHDADEAPVSDPGKQDVELPPGTGLVQAVPQRESRPAFAIHEIGILDHNVPSSFRMRSRPESKEYKA